VRPIALTIPDVMLSASPNGLPIATTSWPGSTFFDVPSVTGCSSPAATPTLMTAMSVEGSEPTSVAFAVVPSTKWTVIDVAPSTTCWFVTMSPFVSTTNPDPSA
jgi:hypothetical protein